MRYDVWCNKEANSRNLLSVPASKLAMESPIPCSFSVRLSQPACMTALTSRYSLPKYLLDSRGLLSSTRYDSSPKNVLEFRQESLNLI
jgi:hypothetical protein